jgi:very-short-patch-repair endonuclease
MQPRIPLPEPFDRASFRVRDALAEGIGEGRLRGADLGRPFHGLRTGVVVDRERTYAPLLRPGERFSHLSAARIWKVPLPVENGPVHTTLTAGTRARTRGVVGHRSAAGVTVTHRGLPVSDPATLVLELATLLDVPALTAAGDHLVLDPRVLDPRDVRPYADLRALGSAIDAAHGRGVRTARAAMALIRQGAESPMETRLRLLAREEGLPEPVLQFELRDRHGRVGWFDLAWPERRLIAEYDGDQHRTSTAQYDRDIRRFDRAHASGWHVVRVRARGLLLDPGETRGRLRAAFDRSLS